ncbi:hypothetical protein [Acinetobacter kyonggiensis]|uniref:Uncharacterized protein n=1 Tax=Acinetobacter kyonggiensis TaxID=595670 RepID=A0A1H3JQY2_9GAMM|nr:hypothetical protein [Acinetobacter kyonggiensis]SDY42370.1 hypothetical protein SAMN05421643_11023 [Acinetobacter kyonggiensis]
MSLVYFSDKIIKNIFINLEIDLDRIGFLKRRDKLDLRILLELILFIRSLDKIRGKYFLVTWNKFYFPVYAYKFYPFEFFTYDFGLKDTHEVIIYGVNRKVNCFESTPRVELYYDVLDLHIKNEKLVSLREQLRPTLNEKNKPVEFNVLDANFFPSKFSEMSVENIAYLNEFLEKFRGHEEFTKRKNDENKAIKKFHEYCEYFNDVTSVSAKSFIFVIEFLIHGQQKLIDDTFINLKKDFMNSIRGYRQLAQISGYMGFWNLAENNNLCFRIMFIVPDIGIEVDEWIEDISYYWENIYFNKIREKVAYQFTGTDAIRFEAVQLSVARSHKKLNPLFLGVGKNNQSMKKLICEHAISYIVLSEFYYCPFELQLYLKFIAIISEEQSEVGSELRVGGKRMFRVFRGSQSKK